MCVYETGPTLTSGDLRCLSVTPGPQIQHNEGPHHVNQLPSLIPSHLSFDFTHALHVIRSGTEVSFPPSTYTFTLYGNVSTWERDTCCVHGDHTQHTIIFNPVVPPFLRIILAGQWPPLLLLWQRGSHRGVLG